VPTEEPKAGSVGWERNQLTGIGSISTQNYGMMGAIVLERPAFRPIPA